MTDIKIGFSMHPRWVGKEGLEAFLKPLQKEGLSALEFELDSSLEMWDENKKLMNRCVDLGMELCFHAPFRNHHTLAGFAGKAREGIIQDYLPLLQIAQDLAAKTGTAKEVVFHGARGDEENYSQLFADTKEFCAWLLETFKDVVFALENNNPTDFNITKIGVTREEVLNLVEGFNSPRLGICWDMGHDYLAHLKDEVSDEWLHRVNHVHVHDVNPLDSDHFPLIYGRVPFARWLAALRREGMKGIVTLELKGGNLAGWSMDEIRKALVSSIQAIAEEVA